MAQSGTAPDPQSGGESTPGVLRAKLAVRPHPDASCAVVGDGREATAVTHSLKPSYSNAGPDEPSSDCECHSEIVYDDEADQSREYRTSSVESRCICPIFDEHDCIPEIQGVEDGSIIVVVSVPSRTELRELVDALRRVGAAVVIDWLIKGSRSETTTEIDVSSITSKQREALEAALELGYYDSPREADLADLADRLDISRSAVSQRLNAAETKLVKSFLDSASPFGNPDA